MFWCTLLLWGWDWPWEPPASSCSLWQGLPLPPPRGAHRRTPSWKRLKTREEWELQTGRQVIWGNGVKKIHNQWISVLFQSLPHSILLVSVWPKSFYNWGKILTAPKRRSNLSAVELSLWTFHALLPLHSWCLDLFIFSHNILSFHIPSLFTRLILSLFFCSSCLSIPSVISIIFPSLFHPGKASLLLHEPHLHPPKLTFPNGCLPVPWCWLAMVGADEGWTHSADRNIKFFHFSSKTIKKANSSMLGSSI